MADPVIEALSRQLAVGRGYDPDELGSSPGWVTWMAFVGEAENALAALRSEPVLGVLVERFWKARHPRSSMSGWWRGKTAIAMRSALTPDEGCTDRRCPECGGRSFARAASACFRVGRRRRRWR